jgi:hypothetical protein
VHKLAAIRVQATTILKTHSHHCSIISFLVQRQEGTFKYNNRQRGLDTHQLIQFQERWFSIFQFEYWWKRLVDMLLTRLFGASGEFATNLRCQIAQKKRLAMTRHVFFHV